MINYLKKLGEAPVLLIVLLLLLLNTFINVQYIIQVEPLIREDTETIIRFNERVYMLEERLKYLEMVLLEEENNI